RPHDERPVRRVPLGPRPARRTDRDRPGPAGAGARAGRRHARPHGRVTARGRTPYRPAGAAGRSAARDPRDPIPAGRVPPDPADAACVLRVIATQPTDDDVIDLALDLAAEAQSALRVAVSMLDRYVDNDQLKLFIWLREMAAERRTLIRRYMRREDPAEPAGW